MTVNILDMQNQQESVSDPAARVVTSPWFTPGTPPFSGPTYILGRKETIHDVVGIPPEKPISLYSLPDPRPGEKPDYTYATLVKIAIWESPAKKLTLQEIYDALEARFLWFKSCNNPNSWKVSTCPNFVLLYSDYELNLNVPSRHPSAIVCLFFLHFRKFRATILNLEKVFIGPLILQRERGTSGLVNATT